MRISAFYGNPQKPKNSYGTGEHGRLDGICPRICESPTGDENRKMGLYHHRIPDEGTATGCFVPL